MKARMAIFTTLWMFATFVALATDRNKTPLETPLQSIGSGPQFVVDFTNLQGQDDQTYVEFYIQVGYQELQFVKDKQQGTFRTGYDLDLLIFDEKGNPVESYTTLDEFHVASYQDTQVKTKARVTQVAFTLAPGKYQIKAMMTDLETQKSTIIDNHFVVRSFQSSDLMISDIQLSQKITGAEPGQPFVKNQRYIEPNAGRVFAHDFSGCFVYFEVYNLAFNGIDEKSTYTTYFIFRNSKGEEIAQFHRRTTKPGEISAHSLKIPLDYFVNGKYVLTVRVRDDNTGQTAESSKSFTVLDTPIILSEASSDDVLY